MKTLFFLLCLMSCSATYSQNLSLSEIIALQKKNLVEFEEYLNTRGWEFFESKKDELNTVTFAYKKSSYDDSAESFLSLFFNDDFSHTSIWVQINKKEKYNEYLKKVKSYNPKLIESGIEDNGIKKVYQGATTTFEFFVSKTQNEYSSAQSEFYTLFVYKN